MMTWASKKYKYVSIMGKDKVLWPFWQQWWSTLPTLAILLIYLLYLLHWGMVLIF